MRLPRFRLRTILIAMVLVGLVASRLSVQHVEGMAYILDLHAVGHAGICVFYFSDKVVEETDSSRVEINYMDRADKVHRLFAIFSFNTCPCCGQSWEWDSEKGGYVE